MSTDEPQPPTVEYEESTGYLVMKDGDRRQIVCRPDPDNPHILWLWSKGRKREVPLTLANLFRELQRAFQDKA